MRKNIKNEWNRCLVYISRRHEKEKKKPWIYARKRMFARFTVIAWVFGGAEPVCREMNYICLVDDYKQKQLKKEKLRFKRFFFFFSSFKWPDAIGWVGQLRTLCPTFVSVCDCDTNGVTLSYFSRGLYAVLCVPFKRRYGSERVHRPHSLTRTPGEEIGWCNRVWLDSRVLFSFEEKSLVDFSVLCSQLAPFPAMHGGSGGVAVVLI